MTKNTTQPTQQEDDVFDCLQDQTLFGKYKVGEKIGSGSQGSVYDLVDLEKPTRKMAIKFSMNTEKQNEEIKQLGSGDGFLRCRLCSHILCHQFQPIFSPA